MNYKVLFFTLLSLVVHRVCLAQEIDWQKADKWKIYNVGSRVGLTCSLDSLQNFKSIDLNIDTMRQFLAGVGAWPKNQNSLWMGLYVLSCDLEGKKRKIIASTTGGFFYDDTSGRYYQLSEEKRSAWFDYLTRYISKIASP